MRKILLMILTFSVFFIFSNRPLEASNLVNIPLNDASGNLKYRNSSKEVKMVETYTASTNEFRGVWVSTVSNIDIVPYSNEAQYKEELIKIMDNLVAWGLNAMIFQVRPMNDALYESEFNAWSTYFTTSNPGWNMLEWLITECHQRGIEFHAWFNPYRVNNDKNTSIENVAKKYKKTNAASNVTNLIKATNGTILNPGEPEVREFVLKTIMEVVENYDIDAVHFDDYFYRPFDSDSNYLNDADVVTYKKYNNNTAPTSNTQMANWRRNQVNLLMKSISDFLGTYNTSHNKAVQFGISPTGIYKNGNGGKTIDDASYNVNLGSNTAGQEHYESYLFADSLYWIQQGWLDYILPQTYWAFEEGPAPYADVVSYWVKATQNTKTKLYVAHGVYMEYDNRPAWKGHLKEVEYQFRFANQFPNVVGHSFFSYKSLRNATETFTPVTSYGLEKMKTEYFKTKSVGAEQSKFVNMTRPTVSSIQSENTQLGKKYTFSSAGDIKGYAIYRTSKNGTLNPSKDLFTFIHKNSIELESLESFDYYIATINRGNYAGNTTKMNIDENDPISSLINKINSLPKIDSIDYSHKDLIKSLMTTFDSLEYDQKLLITNSSTLKDANKKITSIEKSISEIIAKIDQIKTPIYDAKTVILELKVLINGIDSTAKNAITNIAKFNEYLSNIELIDQIIVQINNFSTFNYGQKAAILDLKTQIDQLSEENRNSISNLANLTITLNKINEIDALIAKINQKIIEITTDSTKEFLLEIQKEYESLDLYAKESIINFDKVLDALNGGGSSCKSKKQIQSSDIIISLLLCSFMLVSIPIVIKKNR